MSTPFGPQLIGETEKTLGALLRRVLDGTGLDEPQWVALRLASLLEGTMNANELATALADRVHFTDATDVVAELTNRGLLADGVLTYSGRNLMSAVEATIATDTAPIWSGLPPDDVAATTRLLNEILSRARAVLANDADLVGGEPSG